jgi:cystathionine beta-lyase
MGRRSVNAQGDGSGGLSADEPRRPATRIVEAGRRKEWTGAVVNPPVWRGSTHLYSDCADLARGRPNEDGHFYYGRRGSPTQWALAEALTELEPGAFGTVLYPSGVAAIAGVLLSVLESGDSVLMSDNVYEPSRVMAKALLAPLGIETRFFDPLDAERFADLFDARTGAVLLESPGSLTMEICDVPALAAIARAKGAVSVLDNTWATPLGFAALAHGCDIALMSLTKHVGGHSDLMMGCASAGEELYRRLRGKSQALGQVVSPDDAALALRGLRTVGIRLEREAASALRIAEWLATRPEVAQVLCPCCPAHRSTRCGRATLPVAADC